MIFQRNRRIQAIDQIQSNALVAVFLHARPCEVAEKGVQTEAEVAFVFQLTPAPVIPNAPARDNEVVELNEIIESMKECPAP